MNAERIAATIALALVGAAALTACSNETPAPTPTNAASSVSPSPEPTETGSSTPDTTDEPSTPEVETPEVGTILDPADVGAAREAGASVFVSPTGDGTGLVVEPGYDLPEPVREVVAAIPAGPADGTMAAADAAEAAFGAVHTALDEAGVGAVVIMRGIVVEGPKVTVSGYIVDRIGVAVGDIAPPASTFDSLAAAKAFAEKIAAPVGAQVIVLD